MYKENRFGFLREQTVQDGSVGSCYSLLNSASSFISAPAENALIILTVRTESLTSPVLDGQAHSKALQI